MLSHDFQKWYFYIVPLSSKSSSTNLRPNVLSSSQGQAICWWLGHNYKVRNTLSRLETCSFPSFDIKKWNIIVNSFPNRYVWTICLAYMLRDDYPSTLIKGNWMLYQTEGTLPCIFNYFLRNYGNLALRAHWGWTIRVLRKTCEQQFVKSEY